MSCSGGARGGQEVACPWGSCRPRIGAWWATCTWQMASSCRLGCCAHYASRSLFLHIGLLGGKWSVVGDMLLVDFVQLSPGSDALLTPPLSRSGRMHASSRPRISDGSLLVEEQTRWSGQCKGALRLYSLLKGQGLRRVCPVGGGEHTGLWVHLSKTLWDSRACFGCGSRQS